MSEIKATVIKTIVGVNMGDHAQDVVNVLDVDPEMTIGQLVERELTKPEMSWKSTNTNRVPESENYLTIRVARPVDEEVVKPGEF